MTQVIAIILTFKVVAGVIISGGSIVAIVLAFFYYGAKIKKELKDNKLAQNKNKVNGRQQKS